MCRTTPFQNPATARTAGSCERTGATKAPVLSPAILPIGGFTFGFGVKACSGGSPRLPPHGLDKGHKRVFVGTGMPPRPIRPTQRLTRPNRGDFLFSLSFGPRAVQSGCGRQPAKSVWLPVASQTLCLPRPRGGTFICHRISQNTPCSIMASATRLKPAMLAPATRL